MFNCMWIIYWLLQKKAHIQKIKAQLKWECDMKDLREIKKILGRDHSRQRFRHTLTIPRELYSKGVGMIQYDRNKTGHYSFRMSLQVSSKQCPQLIETEPAQKNRV